MKRKPLREWTPEEIEAKRHALMRAARLRGWGECAEDLAHEALEELLLYPGWTQKTTWLICRAADKFFGVTKVGNRQKQKRQGLRGHDEPRPALHFEMLIDEPPQDGIAETLLALNSLPDAERDAAAAVFVLEDSIRNYARETDQPFSTTQKIVDRAKDALRAHFEEKRIK
jgi:DNA-directed RNA polymerase specialized sigma24 family protein